MSKITCADIFPKLKAMVGYMIEIMHKDEIPRVARELVNSPKSLIHFICIPFVYSLTTTQVAASYFKT